MHRFFINPANIKNGKVHFPSDITHQIINVLRLGEGDLVEVLDDSGKVYKAEVRLEDQKKDVIGKILDEESGKTVSGIRLSLFFGITNRDKVEWILQKGTEVGVTDFYPFVSSRTLTQSLTLSEKKIDRWTRIIREAAEQSQRVLLPHFHSPMDYGESLKLAQNDHQLCLLAWERPEEGSQSLPNALSGFTGDQIALFVGPEGGFSNEEVQKAKKFGFQVISLGKGILRMETASIVFPALVLYELSKSRF